MGHSGSRMKKFRNSLRRLSLSKSIENLRRNDSKLRQSKSLTSLTTKKKNEEKTSRRNTIIFHNNEKPQPLLINKINKDNDEIIIFNENLDVKDETDKLDKIIKIEDCCVEVLSLKAIDSKLLDLENQIDQLSHDDLFVYHSTFKDELHNFWIKAYGIKELNDTVKPKKNETIDNIKRILHKLNNKIYQRKQINYYESLC